MPAVVGSYSGTLFLSTKDRLLLKTGQTRVLKTKNTLGIEYYVLRFGTVLGIRKGEERAK